MSDTPETPEQYRARALKLRLFLGAQLLFFIGWGGWLFFARGSETPEFFLETAPVDPRDLISGTYVALSYPMSDPGAAGCPQGIVGRAYVRLEPSGRAARAGGLELPVYEARECVRDERQAPGWAQASVQGGWRNRAEYGIEKFFLNENDPLKDARSGEVLARVKIGRDRRLQLLGLVRKD